MSNNISQYPGKAVIGKVEHINDVQANDITLLVPEVNIHSSIRSKSSICELSVIDFRNYLSNAPIQAGDAFIITIRYGDEEVKYKYKLQAIEDVTDLTKGRGYNLRLVSDLYYTSLLTKISKSYVGTTTEIATAIFSQHTEEPIGVFEPSAGITTVCIPTWSPIDTIKWLAGRSRSVNSPERFLFYQDSKQLYHFTSIGNIKTLYNTEPITYRLNANTAAVDNGAGELANSAARNTEILVIDYKDSYNLSKSLASGNLQNTIMTTDLTTKQLSVQSNNYWDTFNKSESNSGSQWRYEPSAPGNVVNRTVTLNNSTVPGHNKPNDETNDTFEMDRSQEIEITVHGNNVVDIGHIINVEIPSPESQTLNKQNDLDLRWSGQYYVTAKRDIIDTNKHRMILKCAKNSQMTGFIS